MHEDIFIGLVFLFVTIVSCFAVWGMISSVELIKPRYQEMKDRRRHKYVERQRRKYDRF